MIHQSRQILINLAQKMPSIQRRISIEFKNERKYFGQLPVEVPLVYVKITVSFVKPV